MPTGRRTALARRRRALGMSQERLAIRLGVDVKSVARWEHGASEPQPWNRPALARASVDSRGPRRSPRSPS
ncbi:helix-turn-helix domain-containing protein [Actinospica robiniae]|uniref:helix-turn-helix domain-containing protein n=1 Tax=Actinospica robiniae TaxID=304901 RepID=UPI000A04D613